MNPHLYKEKSPNFFLEENKKIMENFIVGNNNNYENSNSS